MKKKIMNVCGVAFVAVSILACSGQKKGMAATEMASDSTKVVGDVITTQADSTGDRKSTRLNSSHNVAYRMPSSA